MGLRFYIKFENDSTYTEITEYIKDNSIEINTSLMNQEFKSVQDVAKATTIYDKYLADKFFRATTWMPAYIENDLQAENVYGFGSSSEHGFGVESQYGFLSEGRIFTGAVYPNTEEILRDYPDTGVSFEIIDNSYILEVDNKAVTIPEVFGDTYHVFNPSVPSKSLIHILLNQTLLSFEAIDDSYAILEEVDPRVFEANKNSIKDLVQDILYEYHHVYYFDENGRFCLYNWKHDEINIEDNITEENILDGKGITRERNIFEYDGYKVLSKPISSKTNNLLYRDSFDEDGKLLLANQVYPTDGEVKEVKQRYSTDWLPDKASIISTYNQILEIDVDNGIDVVTEEHGSIDSQVVLKNNSAGDKRIRQFDIRGDVYFTDGEEELLIPNTLEKSEEIKLEYVKNSTQVHNFAEALYNNTIKYGKYNYTFESEEHYKIGSVYNISNRDYSVDVLVIDKKCDLYNEIYTYECIGLGLNIAQVGGSSYMKPTYTPTYVPSRKPNSFYSLLSNVDEFPTTETTTKESFCYVHGFSIEGVSKDINGQVKYPDPNNATFFVDVPKQAIDLTNQVFQNVEVDRDFWTYLVLNNDVITPVWYSVADAVFYDELGNVVNDGLVIGEVKVGTIAPEHTQSTIWEATPYDVAKTLNEVVKSQVNRAFKHLSQATTPEEFEQYAENLGITDYFTTLAVWELFTEKIKVNQLQVGNGSKDEGFVFYAIDDRESGESVIQAWSDGVKIFEINPKTKNITIGDYEKENGIRWVDESGELVFKGTGKFTGNIDHESLKTREEDNSGAIVDTPSKTRYKGKDLYDTLSSVSTSEFTSVNGTYDSKNINSISRMPNTNSLRQIAYKSSSGNISIPCPMTCRAKITYNSISTFLNNTTTNLYVNGAYVSGVYCSNWGDTKTVTVYKDVIKGQIISTSNSGQNKTQYVKVEAYGDGTILKISDSEMYLLKKEGFFSKQLNITSPNTFNYNSFKKYASGQDFINNASSLALDKTYSTSLPHSNFSINGEASKTVSSVLKMLTEMRLYFTDGKLQTITKDNSEGATTGWYNMSGSFRLLTATSAILTKNIEPQDNAQYDLGYKGVSASSDKRINNIYLSTSIQGDETSEIKGFNQFDMLTGMVAPFATNTTPIGWLKCDGTAYLRDSYSTLFSRIGTTYGSTNGSNFRVPDLRGEFIRGLDNGRGVDSGRSLGSNQSDSLKSHKHKYYEPSSLGSSASGVGGASGFTTNKTDTWATGDSETRPRNVALVYYIKY